MHVRPRVVVLTCALAVLGACSTPAPQKPTTSVSGRTWEGRLSVTVQSDPPRLNSAGFQLQGSAQRGELALFSPMGTTVAQLQWNGTEAFLRQGQEAQRFASMAELTEQVTGSALPVPALFDWLQGQASPVVGWQVDVSGIQQGKLSAQRTQPLPVVLLRIQLEP